MKRLTEEHSIRNNRKSVKNEIERQQEGDISGTIFFSKTVVNESDDFFSPNPYILRINIASKLSCFYFKTEVKRQ